MENFKFIIISIVLPTIYWMFKPKKLLKFLVVFNDSNAGIYFFKTFAIAGVISFTVLNLLTSNLILLKYELSEKGFYISTATFLILTGLTLPFFYLMFKDLFFPKNTNNQKPFSIV